MEQIPDPSFWQVQQPLGGPVTAEVGYSVRAQPGIIKDPPKTFVPFDLCAGYLLTAEIPPKTGVALCAKVSRHF